MPHRQAYLLHRMDATRVRKRRRISNRVVSFATSSTGGRSMRTVACGRHRPRRLPGTAAGSVCVAEAAQHRHRIQQHPRIGMLWRVEDAHRIAFLYLLAVAHHQHAVCHLRHHAHVVRDEDQPHAVFALQARAAAAAPAPAPSHPARSSAHRRSAGAAGMTTPSRSSPVGACRRTTGTDSAAAADRLRDAHVLEQPLRLSQCGGLSETLMQHRPPRRSGRRSAAPDSDCSSAPGTPSPSLDHATAASPPAVRPPGRAAGRYDR